MGWKSVCWEVGEIEEKSEYGQEKRVMGGGEIEKKTEYGLEKRVWGGW